MQVERLNREGALFQILYQRGGAYFREGLMRGGGSREQLLRFM